MLARILTSIIILVAGYAMAGDITPEEKAVFVGGRRLIRPIYFMCSECYKTCSPVVIKTP